MTYFLVLCNYLCTVLEWAAALQAPRSQQHLDRECNLSVGPAALQAPRPAAGHSTPLPSAFCDRGALSSVRPVGLGESDCTCLEHAKRCQVRQRVCQQPGVTLLQHMLPCVHCQTQIVQIRRVTPSSRSNAPRARCCTGTARLELPPSLSTPLPAVLSPTQADYWPACVTCLLSGLLSSVQHVELT